MELPKEISTAKLLSVTGIPRRTLTRWSSDGVISPLRRGVWELEGTMRAVVSHLRVQHESGSDKTKLLREQIRFRRIKNDALDADLVSRIDVEDGYKALAGEFKAAILALGARLAPEITNVSSQGQVRSIVDQEVRRILAELSQRLHEISARLRGE